MPLIRRNYRDLSPELRREGAKARRAQILGALKSPGLAAEQIKLLQVELQKINQWEAGELGLAVAAPIEMPPGMELFKR